MGRRSRSRSRRKSTKARSPSPKTQKSSKGSRTATASKPAAPEERNGRKANKAPVAAAAASEEEAEEAEESAEEDGAAQASLEARIALLEVENAALKAENRELKKRLVEALSRKGGGQALVSAKPGQPPPVPERPAEPPSGGGEGGGGAAAAADRRRERLAAAAEVPASDRAQRRHREEGVGGAAVREAERRAPSPEGPPEDEAMHANAVMLVNGAMEAYNEPIPNNIPPEKRLPMVNGKLERFLSSFDDRIQILDLKSGGAVIKDKKTFTMRYGCVFRESGAKLKGSTLKRFYYDAPGGKPTYTLDFETHESLVTATPGTPQDGKLGVREPRTEHLAVLYEEKGGKITRMWLRQDAERLGIDPTAGEEIVSRTEGFKAFEAKIAELKGGDAGPRIFHNYHETPTVG